MIWPLLQIEDWMAFGFFCLLWWLPQNAIHEGSHALWTLIFGGKIKKFCILPNRQLGYFTFACIIPSYPKPLTPRQKSLFFIGPVLTNTILILALGIVSASMDLTKAELAIKALQVTNYIDGLNNLLAVYLKSEEGEDKYDVELFMKYSNWSAKICRRGAILWKVLLLLWIVLVS